jgi:hypothetical protein
MEEQLLKDGTIIKLFTGLSYSVSGLYVRLLKSKFRQSIWKINCAY